MIVRRLLMMPVLLWVIYTITFVLTWMVPGNPMEKGEGRRPPEEIVEAMKSQYRLDSPWAFYWNYLGNITGVNYLRGQTDKVVDLGPSLAHENWTVNEILASGLPVSIELGCAAMALAVVIGVSTGILGAMRPGSIADFATYTLPLVGVSLPTFVVGTALLMVFTVSWPVFPIARWGGITSLALPAATLSLPFAAYIARLTRFSMLEQLSQDYVRTARAKGISPGNVVIGHVLRNAFLPVLSYLGPASAAALTGSFVVERVFAVPGIGTHFVDAVLAKDLTLIMGVVLTYSAILIAFNLIVDVLYAALDPRIGRA